MTSAEQVTKFVVRSDRWITPVGTFGYHGLAAEACKGADIPPEGNITHEIDMCKVSDLVKAIETHCKALNSESLDYFTVSPSIKYDGPDALVPVKRSYMIAFAVEGGSEGYYVHVGAILKESSNGKTWGGNPEYMDFGFAKLFSREEASLLATEAQRFLSATEWNS